MIKIVTKKRFFKFWLVKVIRKFGTKRTNLTAGIFIGFIAFIGLFADILASQKPIIASIDGKLHILPALFYTPELVDYDNQTIMDKLSRDGGWAILPPVPFGPNQSKVSGDINWLQKPSYSSGHLIGTDGNGRDVLSRLIHGARSALMVGIGSMIICTFLGLFLGALSAYFGGLSDRITTTAIETMTAFPTLFLILAVQGLLGISSLWQLALVIAATTWTDVARVTRAEVLKVVNEEYIDAARALGLGNFRILIKHVMPAIMGPVLVSATFGIASAILLESTLSFLGYGAPPPVASWGQLLADAFTSSDSYWLVIFPGTLLFLTVLSINITGEGLSDSVNKV